MSASATGQATKVCFANLLTSMAGPLFIPANMDRIKKYPALAVADPFGRVKEFMSKAGAQPKDWFEAPGATHHNLYDKEAQAGEAVVKLEDSVAVDRRGCLPTQFIKETSS